MTIARFALASLAAGTAATMTDWFFTAVLFHEKYTVHPEVWRRSVGTKGESAPIFWSILLGYFTCAVFVGLCGWLGLAGWLPPARLAVAVWAIGPMPLVITNSLWMKLHPALAVAHGLGWLAKLLLSAAAVALIA